MATKRPLVSYDGRIRELASGDDVPVSAAVQASLDAADSAVQSIQPGANVTIDASDPSNPVISATGGGTSIQFPFYTAAGGFDPIPLTSSSELPFYLANGTQSNIPMVTA